MSGSLFAPGRDCSHGPRQAHRPSGFTLIELMIAMLLGLIVIAGVASIFLANQRIYRTNGALGDVQDGSRITFEMMADGIRSAGLTGCANNGEVANILKDGSHATAPDWWANWSDNVLHGYVNGTSSDPALAAADSNQVAGTDSLMLLEAADSSMSVASNDSASGTFTLNQIDSGSPPKAGDDMVVCDPDHAVLFRATSYDGDSKAIGYAPQGSLANCTTNLGYVAGDVCTGAAKAYTYGSNALVSRLVASDWYIGTNPAGGKSLYRMSVDTSTGTATAQEMVRNVTEMDILYHQSPLSNFTTADLVTDWSKVDAVNITFTLQSMNTRAGVNAKPITRKFVATTTVRNRVN